MICSAFIAKYDLQKAIWGPTLLQRIDLWSWLQYQAPKEGLIGNVPAQQKFLHQYIFCFMMLQYLWNISFLVIRRSSSNCGLVKEICILEMLEKTWNHFKASKSIYVSISGMIQDALNPNDILGLITFLATVIESAQVGLALRWALCLLMGHSMCQTA